MHININWSTGVEPNAGNTAAVHAIEDEEEVTPAVVRELMDKLPNFKRSYELSGMKPEEFDDYGPTTLFRTQFMNGYARLLDGIVGKGVITNKNSSPGNDPTGCFL